MNCVGAKMQMLELLSKDIVNIVYKLLHQDRLCIVLLQYSMYISYSITNLGAILYKSMAYNYRSPLTMSRIIYNIRGKRVGTLPDNY